MRSCFDGVRRGPRRLLRRLNLYSSSRMHVRNLFVSGKQLSARDIEGPWTVRWLQLTYPMVRPDARLEHSSTRISRLVNSVARGGLSV
jgi:hypothetical protein